MKVHFAIYSDCFENSPFSAEMYQERFKKEALKTLPPNSTITTEVTDNHREVGFTITETDEGEAAEAVLELLDNDVWQTMLQEAKE